MCQSSLSFVPKHPLFVPITPSFVPIVHKAPKNSLTFIQSFCEDKVSNDIS